MEMTLPVLVLIAALAIPAAPFVRVPASYLAQCRLTARTLGYPVPCPTRLPAPMTRHQDGATPDCNLTVICPSVRGPWKGWATGSLSDPTQHLVVTASPRPLSDDAKAADGPGWSSSARVRPLAWVTTGRWRMRAVFVSPDTNEGMFVHHVAMVWTVGKHTYAVGFHDFTGMRTTLRLDQQLARWIELIGP
ncbi:MAG TPA: hypothetical protein VG265_11505 [Gaiellaceae bacterium]|nr:hypothetical protein [Gaiellaceae bacterium]